MYRKGFNDYEILGKYSLIFLRGKHSEKHPTARIDTKNLDKLIKLNVSWNVHLEINKKFYYVSGTEYLGMVNGKPKYKHHKLHRYIMNESDSRVLIDHINNDTFDNTEENFRRTVQKNNLKNRRSKNSNNTSGYRNVSWIRNYWRIQLQIDGKNYLFPEKFIDVDEAGRFAEEMRQKYYKKFSGLD